METRDWQLLHRHLTSILEQNIRIVDSVFLAQQLASQLQSETTYTKTGNLQHHSQETSWTNHQEELT